MIDLDTSFTPDKVRAWAESQPVGATLGVAVSTGMCPLATYLSEVDPDHTYFIDNFRIQIDDEGRYALPEWAMRVIDQVDCNALGTEIPASVFIAILDTVDNTLRTEVQA